MIAIILLSTERVSTWAAPCENIKINLLPSLYSFWIKVKKAVIIMVASLIMYRVSQSQPKIFLSLLDRIRLQ